MMGKIGIRINQDFAFSRFMMKGKKSSTVFFPGCAFMKLGLDINHKVLELIRKVDRNAEMCSLCCSYPSQVLDKTYHTKQKEKIIEFLKERDVKTIYTACPNCFNTLNLIFKEYSVKVKVQMLYTLLDKEIDSINKGFIIDEAVVLHDPCSIKCDKDTQNAVRRILDKIGQKYIDIEDSKERTICCGNINMLHVTAPKKSAIIRKRRVSELKKGANVICSYCNGCLNTFRKDTDKLIHLLELAFGKVKKSSFLNRVLLTIKLEKK